MKKFYILLVLFSVLINSQEIKKLDINDYVVKASFLENKYNEKYLLIGDFIPVYERSKIKLAKVYTNTGWGYIDEKGNEIVKPIYKQLSDFYNGYVMASEKVIPYFDWHFEEFPIIINYLGEILTCTKDYIYLINYKDRYQKDFFVTSKNKKNGVLNYRGKELVPFKYTDINYSDNYFFAYNYIDFEAGISKFDIYTKKGKFLKTILSNGITETQNLFITGLKSDSYFLDKHFDRIDNRNFCSINAVEDSKKIKYEVQICDSTIKSFFLDNQLHLINPSFPDSFNYEDKYLVQPVGINYYEPTKYIISDFKNRKIAEYSLEDFIIYQYFAYGKLDDPQFLESQKEYWKKIEKDNGDYYSYNKWDYFKDLEKRKRYIQFYELDQSTKKRISIGFIDATTGKTVIKRNLNEVADVRYITGTDFFQVKYDNNDRSKFDIYNSKGKFVRSDFGDYIGSDYNYLYNITPEFYILNKGKSTFNNSNITSEQLLRKKDMSPVFGEDNIFFSTTLNNYAIFGYYKDYKLGIIDHKYKIMKPAIYETIFSPQGTRTTDVFILQKYDNHNEIIDAKTTTTLIEIQFKNGAIKKHGLYKNGFYLINEEKNIMDRYGNIISKPIDFDMFRN